MKNKFVQLLVALAFIISVPSFSSCEGGEEECCKVCTTGKACGDSCISKNDTCTKPAGCACNG